MVTDVLDLETGEILTYALPPTEALKNAFLQYRRTEAMPEVKTSIDGNFLFIDDFFTLNK
jgi:hypothetical protein